jgi:hypothetical protein
MMLIGIGRFVEGNSHWNDVFVETWAAAIGRMRSDGDTTGA